MDPFRIEVRRSGVVESVHRVSAAVVRPDGALVAQAGDPDLVTFWRSAAKPFQALPLVEDGVLDAFGLGSEELALACASHSSEPVHLALVERFLARIGCTESDLACGTHTPLGREIARQVATRGTVMTPRWSNCSGKHAGMLALARHHGWPTLGYERRDHPVQARLLEVIAAWTGLPAQAIGLGVDGCTTVCFALPLRRMARAYAALAVSEEPAPAQIREAMFCHPDLVAGASRFCTEVMLAMPGVVLAKVGAGGIYSAALLPERLGIALKVEDGDAAAAPLALLGILRQVTEVPRKGLEAWEALSLHDTRGNPVGEIVPAGALRFLEP